MFHSSLFIQVIILSIVLFFLIIDFCGMKNKKRVYIIGIVVLGIEISTVHFLEKSDYFNFCGNKQVVKIEDKKEKNTSNLSIKERKAVEDKTEEIKKEMETAEKKQNIKNNIEETIEELPKEIENEKRQTKEAIEKQIEMEKQERKEERIQKYDVFIEDNKMKIEKMLVSLNALGENMESTKAWEEKVLAKIERGRKLCDDAKKLEMQKNLTEEQKSYLIYINKVENSIDTLEKALLKEKKQKIHRSFETIKNL